MIDIIDIVKWMEGKECHLIGLSYLIVKSINDHNFRSIFSVHFYFIVFAKN